MGFLRQRSTRRWLIIAGLVVAVIGLGVHVFGYPVHFYEGRALAASEFLALVDSGQTLHCVQLPAETLWDSLRMAGAYDCFDSEPVTAP